MTFAARQGVGERAARMALRAAFAEGVNLSLPAHVLTVCDRAGLPAAEVQAAVESHTIKTALRDATAAAHAAGVFGVPTVAAGGELFWGDDRLEDAAAALA